MVNNYPNQNNRNNSNSNNQQNSAQRFYDQPTDMQYNDSNNHHQRQIRLVPPPSRKNMDHVDSPRTPGRRTRSELNDDDDFQQDVQNKKQRQRSTEVEFDNQWENRQRSHNEDNSLLQQQQYHHQHQQIQINVTNNDNNNPSPPRPTQQHEQKQQHPQQQRFSLRTTDARTIAHENRSNQQSNRITSESARYAQTRFPFQPFIIRFSSGKVKEKQAAQELVKHYKDIQHTDMSIAHIRQSTLKCQQNDYDLLIYVKDSLSFITLFDQQNWPKKIDGMDFTFPSTPSFPPQLAFIIKNVDLQMNMDDFTNEVKTTYPEIHNVIRLKNKFQNNIKLIKIEILSSMKREEILNKGKIIVQSMTYDVEAYLAPADVLICSKCMGIGHFRRQCTEADETCKVCGTSCPDLRQHKCSTVIKCIHCDGDHHSNALKCPIVKSYRSTLTKKLLSVNRPPPPPSAWSNNNNNNGNANINNNYQHNWSDYPQLPPPQQQNIPYSAVSNEMINKIGELIGSMQKFNDTLKRIEKKNQDFEQFIVDSKNNDASLFKKLDQLNEKDKDYKKVHTQHDIKLTRHENVFTKLVLPMLDEIAKFMVNINVDINRGVLNADFQVTINRMRAQLNNANLSHFDFSLYSQILAEWESSPLLLDCFKIWEPFKVIDTSSIVKSLHILSFNVRGLDLRHQEVLLLANTFKFDILILLETELGENSNGGVVIFVRNDLKTERMVCNLPNVCAIDIIAEEPIRIIGVYAPETSRNTSSHLSVSFWSRTKKFMRSSSASLNGFISQNGEVVKEAEKMCELAADHYENFFREPDNIYRPHPYTDAPEIEWENFNEEIPPVTIEEIMEVVNSRKKKKSCDAHGMSNFMFSSLPVQYWCLLLQIFNLSFSSAIVPKQWKETRVLLLAKKESICEVMATRPISLLDVFLKVDEKLFLTRFRDLLQRRGILPDTQSGFRPGFRLQTRVLLFLEQISSLMANSSPVATVFVDFRAAFDQLWFDGCIGKLKKMGIPRAYRRWINTWLRGRRAYIEIG
ncbi:unnamed protein product, partial [Rotaria socialis]